jgi:hypothetical protein
MIERRKIYYIPGLISLTLLFFICYFYLNKHIVDERVIRVNSMIPYNKSSNNHSFDTSIFSKYPYKRNFHDIIFTGKKDDIVKLEYYRIRMKEIYSNKDTVNGIHLIFGDSSKYELLVKVLDYSAIDSITFLSFYTNNIWGFYIKNEIKSKDQTIKPFCSTSDTHITIPKADEIIWSKILIKFIFPSLLYIVLVLLNIYRITTRTYHEGFRRL